LRNGEKKRPSIAILGKGKIFQVNGEEGGNHGRRTCLYFRQQNRIVGEGEGGGKRVLPTAGKEGKIGVRKGVEGKQPSHPQQRKRKIICSLNTKKRVVLAPEGCRGKGRGKEGDIRKRFRTREKKIR